MHLYDRMRIAWIVINALSEIGKMFDFVETYIFTLCDNSIHTGNIGFPCCFDKFKFSKPL